jgi:hypothetical protein
MTGKQTIDCRLRQQTYCHEQWIAGFASKPIVMNREKAGNHVHGFPAFQYCF